MYRTGGGLVLPEIPEKYTTYTLTRGISNFISAYKNLIDEIPYFFIWDAEYRMYTDSISSLGSWSSVKMGTYLRRELIALDRVYDPRFKRDYLKELIYLKNVPRSLILGHITLICDAITIDDRSNFCQFSSDPKLFDALFKQLVTKAGTNFSL